MGEGIEKEGCGQLLRKGLECRAPGIGLLFSMLQATLGHFKQVKHAVFLSRIVWGWGEAGRYRQRGELLSKQ